VYVDSESSYIPIPEITCSRESVLHLYAERYCTMITLVGSLCLTCESDCTQKGKDVKGLDGLRSYCLSYKGLRARTPVVEREPDYDDDDYDPMGFGFGWTQP